MSVKHIVFDCDGTLLDPENPMGKALYPGILELLQRLKSHEGFTLHIWTGRQKTSVLKFLNQFQLTSFFTEIYSTEGRASKPNPIGLGEMLPGVNPSEVVVIGDSWVDMEGARLYKAHAIGALWNGKVEAAVLQEFGAQALAFDPLSCYDLILKM